MMKRVLGVGFFLFAVGCSGGGGGADLDASSADGGAVDARPDFDAAPVICDVDEVKCDNTCIDPDTSREYCGATTCEDDATDGEQCAPGSVCDGSGTCIAFTCEAVGGGGGGLECNPVTQAGCAVGEKCAQLVESASPLLARTACVPDGTAPPGANCTICGDGSVGYDDCVAGAHCNSGTCTEICQVGPPDTCRTAGQAVDEGAYCTLTADQFSDDIGVCVSACSPIDDTVSGGVVVNNDCAADEGCYLNATRGLATCSNVPGPAETVTQNQDCYGPGGGGCFLNGCASGFTALLNNAPENADGTVCARYCEPDNTHTGNTGNAAGVAGNCDTASLGLIGGTNGATGRHQCRFVQNFYSNTDNVSAEVGICVPVLPVSGGTWGDCEVYDHDGLVAVYNAGTTSEEQETAFNNFCLTNPGEPANSDITAQCMGLFRGCISLEKENELVDVGGP